jgi:hypothetical protein
VNEPIDLARSTWSAALDWFLAIATFLVGAVVAAVVLEAALGDSGTFFFAFGGIAGLYLVAWWRGSRMRGGLDAIDAAAAQGGVSMAVRLKGRSMIQPIGSGRDAVLTIADGVVRLSGPVEESWAASSVRLGRLPSWFANRGIELVTPTGSRFVSSVRTTDPAMYVSAWLDGRAARSIASVLATNAARSARVVLNPAGWYPDPSGAAAWRWWDGQQWGPLSAPTGG